MDKLKRRIQDNIHKMDVDEPNASTWNGLKRRLSKPTENDPLKNHIAENKNELEIETPGVQSWEKISRSIAAKKHMPVQRIRKAFIYLSAACIITMISMGVFRYMNVDQLKPDKDVPKKTAIKNSAPGNDTAKTGVNEKQLTATPPLPDKPFKQTIEHKSRAVASSKPVKKQTQNSLPPEVLQIQKDYDQLIAGQIAYTKSLAVYGESASYFQEFMYDFKILEIQEQELRNSIAQDGLQENSIDELTVIYQQKLTVLKKLQNEINKTSTRNKYLTDTIPVYIKL